MKSRMTPSLIRSLRRRLLLSAFLATAILPQLAQAGGDMCAEIFMTAEMKAHEQKYDTFVRPGNVEGRLGFMGSRHLLNALRKILPAGEYDVTVDFMKRDKLYVSYAADGNVTLNISNRQRIQSDSRPIQRGFSLAKNVSYGIDGRVQLLNGNRMAVSTTIVRGDEKTLAGLERTDLTIELSLSATEKPVLQLTETRSNWSVHRAEVLKKTTQSRIEPRG